MSRMLAEEVRLLSQKQRTLLRMSQQAAQASGSCGLPFPQSPTGLIVLHMQWVCGASQEPQVQGIQISSYGCKETGLPFAPEREITFIVLTCKIACRLLQKEALTVSSKAVPCPNILEKIAQNKGRWCLCHQDMQKHERPTENGIPTPSQQPR